MESKDYVELEKMSDHQLFDFVTESEKSQRKWVAVHLLELRRNKAITSAAKSSAIAAWFAAGVAFVSAFVAILAYFHMVPK